jgi:hypothetical protein
MWAVMTLTHDEIDVNPPGGEPMQPTVMKSRADLLAGFDALVKQTRDALAATSDEAMMKPWTLKSGGREVLTMPRAA